MVILKLGPYMGIDFSHKYVGIFMFICIKRRTTLFILLYESTTLMLLSVKQKFSRKNLNDNLLKFAYTLKKFI